MQTCKQTWNQLFSVICHRASRGALIPKRTATKNIPSSKCSEDVAQKSLFLILCVSVQMYFQAVWSTFCRSFTYYPHLLYICLSKIQKKSKHKHLIKLRERSRKLAFIYSSFLNLHIHMLSVIPMMNSLVWWLKIREINQKQQKIWIVW